MQNTQEDKTYTLDFVFRQIANGYIDLDAPYQRKIVWNLDKQAELINSLYTGYYVFPVLFVKRTIGDKARLVCVDGKQRLTSISKFFKNEVPLILHDEMVVYFYSAIPAGYSLRGHEVKIMTDDMQRDIASKGIHTVTLTGIDIDQEREIFYRIQNGVPLTVGEKMSAMDNEATSFAKELCSKYFASFEKLMKGTRGNDLLFFLRTIAICNGDTTSLAPVTSLRKYVKNLKITEEIRAQTIGNVERLEKLVALGLYKEIKNPGIVPLNIATIIISKYSEMDDEDILMIIKDICDKLREKNKKADNDWFKDVPKYLG